MRILAVADEPSKALWDFYTPDKLEGIDLIISCGDLSPHYLQFLVTLSSCPLLYVPGNHDDCYEKDPPEGCVNIDEKIFNFRGLRIMGLGGSMRYKDSPNMYTEKQMAARAARMQGKILYTGGIDLLVTHAPARGYGDLEDLPHRGFACFNTIMNKCRPLYMLHGHVHGNYTAHFERVTQHPSGTRIINAYISYLLDIPQEEYRPYGESESFLYDRHCRIRRKFRSEECLII